MFSFFKKKSPNLPPGEQGPVLLQANSQPVLSANGFYHYQANPKLKNGIGNLSLIPLWELTPPYDFFGNANVVPAPFRPFQRAPQIVSQEQTVQASGIGGLTAGQVVSAGLLNVQFENGD